MKDIMLDLETLGTEPGAIILSIGAVSFDELGIGEESFHCVVSIASSAGFGLTENPETRKWWNEQSEEARRTLHEAETAGVGMTLPSALYAFNDFVFGLGSNIRVWGNGADFDNCLLRAAYRAADIKLPWGGYNSRCYRTVRKAFPDVKRGDREGTHHNALDDARHQAKHLVEICRTRGWRLM